MTIRFHERFEIEVDDKEAKKRFLNRVHNLILGQFWTNEIQYKNKVNIVHEIAWELGLEYKSGTDIKPYIGADFYRCLQALEVIHKNISGDPQKNLETFITRALQDSEIDLSIRWENGKFIKSGAKLLDEKLVNDSLRWLIDEDYQTVFEPFLKDWTIFYTQKRSLNYLLMLLLICMNHWKH